MLIPIGPGHTLLSDPDQEPQDANWPRGVQHTIPYAARAHPPSLCALFAYRILV